MDAIEIYRDCNASERDVLYTLRIKPGLTISAITRQLDYSNNAISNAVHNLEERGLVKREPAWGIKGDSYHNRLTDKGEVVTQAAFDAYGEAV